MEILVDAEFWQGFVAGFLWCGFLAWLWHKSYRESYRKAWDSYMEEREERKRR